MKDIMHEESQLKVDGVANFSFDPRRVHNNNIVSTRSPLRTLKQELLNDFKDKKITMKDLYLQHNVGKPYVEKNYKEALISLEEESQIVCEPPRIKRMRAGKVTLGENVLVSFLKSMFKFFC